MVIFVHMASVWVPFTSESKEAIADYDEIQKEITLALRECGRRLGLFLRRRERAASEYRRRNIFELYIEEVVEACNRLKGGKLAKEKIKMQLQKIANSRTGGLKTDEALGRTGGGPEGLPHSIIVTEEGVEGDVAAAAKADAVNELANPMESDLLGASAPVASKPDKAATRTAKGRQVPPAPARRKADQMPLFDKAEQKPPAARASDRSKPQKARNKK
jgi:DNA topoisomerase VI subunit B